MTQKDIKLPANTQPDIFSDFFIRKMSGDFRDRGSIESLLNCRITMLDVQQVFPVKKQDFRLHTHKEYEIILPRTSYHCQVNGTELTVKRGELLLLQPGDTHLDHLDPEEPYDTFRFCCQISALLPFQNILNEITPEQHKTAIKNYDSLQRLLALLWEEINGVSEERFLVANGIFQGIFWKFLVSFDERLFSENLIKKTKSQSKLQKFLKVLHNHLNDFPDIQELCHEIGMSHSSLSRLSLKNFNHPPLRMLMFYKVQYAKECLDCIPGITIKELSDKLGFSDQFHFSKVFRRFFKMPPSEYIKKGRASALQQKAFSSLNN